MHANKKIGQHAGSMKLLYFYPLGHVPYFSPLLFTLHFTKRKRHGWLKPKTHLRAPILRGRKQEEHNNTMLQCIMC